MFSNQVVEEKFKFLFEENLRNFFDLKDLKVESSFNKNGMMTHYVVNCHMEYKGAVSGQLWEITKALDYVSSYLTSFFEKYKLLENGKISLKSSKPYNVDDLFFAELHFNVNENFEFWVDINVYIGENDER